VKGVKTLVYPPGNERERTEKCRRDCKEGNREDGEEIRGGEREETKEERKRGNAEIEESDVREQS
jgi:hypothetical protein